MSTGKDQKPERPRPFERFRPHPWHGLSPGKEPPDILQVYIEITPFDLVKYEIDKETGYLRVDRPQRTSSLPPTVYGFVPRTLCAERTAALSPGADRGDGDPLDICVFTEQPINRAEALLDARVIGMVRMLDDGAADDKIIAVLLNDNIWGEARSLDDIPHFLLERLQHYFATYKRLPEEKDAPPVEVKGLLGPDEARKVVAAALEDYRAEYGDEDSAAPE